MSSTPAEGAAGKPASRTAPELAVLLLELSRIVKARRFYGPGDTRLAEVFGRSLRAWRSDLSRNGPLALEVRADGFAEVGGGGVLHHARLDELLNDLRRRGVERLAFDTDMDGDALGAFADLVASEPARDAGAESFAQRMRMAVPVGIAVEVACAAPAAHAMAPAPVAPAAPAVSAADAAPEAPPVAAEPQPASAEAPLVSPDADTLPMDPAEQLSQLDMLLAELEVCDATSAYVDLARRAIREAASMRDEKALFRVADRLAADAEAKQERLQETAARFLQQLCEGEALPGLLERVAHAEGAEQVRAAQILALVGEPMVAPILERMSAFPERLRRERLAPLILTFGERAVPELMLRLARPERDASRSAALLLGMLQHPAAIPRLAELAVEADAELREEAAKALVRIGNDDAVAALARGLRGPSAEIVLATAHHLAATTSARAVAPLGHALERALEAKDANLAKELLRALGRVGRPEANVIFGSVMRRKSGIGNRWMRDVKVAAATALATVPGDQAVALLAEALQARDDGLRRAAQRALDRRAESVSRAVPGALR